jgi:ribosomal protein S18 acetylase RimI-like enzyme
MPARDYTGPADVRVMQQLAQRLWSPQSQWHIGDLAHGRFQHLGRERDWPTRLWFAGDRIVGWGWVELPDYLSFQVDPAHPEVADEVLAWFATLAPGPRTAGVLGPFATAALTRNGYRLERDGPYFVHQARDLEGLPAPIVPEGFRLRAAPDAERRAAVHAAAFAPSRVTADSYRAVMAAWPYRPELDWVAETPDGRFASYATLWLDERHGAGLIEPVGTDPAFRRLGLARAVCLAALHALRKAGATQAYVNPRGDADYPIPARLYRSLGFTDEGRTYSMRIGAQRR